ncbi:hypothetical protein BJ912DRAFT_1139838 [Pholiota molesta]|nr:hypothetical protein BJ912DRAFT_1139838 [Pholiota molesta]
MPVRPPPAPVHPRPPPKYPLPHPYSMGSAPPPADGAEGIAPPPPPFSPLKAYEGWEKQQDERSADHGGEGAHGEGVAPGCGYRAFAIIMVELTEATLESVLTTAEALKAKLAEHRAEREKQQKLLEEQVAAQRRDPPRLV